MRTRIELRKEFRATGLSGLRPSQTRELTRRLERAAKLLGFVPGSPAPISVMVVDLEQMSAFHESWMGLEGPTDVLSLPAAASPGRQAGGDLVLCWPWILDQAARGQAQSPMHEATILGVHGLVHLRGHDHATPRESRRMHRLEQRVLRALRVPDLPRPYVR